MGGIFKLTAGTHQYVSLYDFQPADNLGSPASNVILDSAGNLYGVAAGGVWRIEP
jgi:hypothetical protein